MAERRVAGTGLVAECEAFLSGVLVEQLIGAAADVPWTWTNLLEHGTGSRLQCPRCRSEDREARISPRGATRGRISHMDCSSVPAASDR